MPPSNAWASSARMSQHAVAPVSSGTLTSWLLPKGAAAVPAAARKQTAPTNGAAQSATSAAAEQASRARSVWAGRETRRTNRAASLCVSSCTPSGRGGNRAHPHKPPALLQESIVRHLVWAAATMARSCPLVHLSSWWMRRSMGAPRLLTRPQVIEQASRKAVCMRIPCANLGACVHAHSLCESLCSRARVCA